MSFLYNNINIIITSHYYLIKIIPTYYKDSNFLNLCEKFIVENLLEQREYTITITLYTKYEVIIIKIYINDIVCIILCSKNL